MRYGICIPVCTLYVSWTWIICQTDVIYAYMHACVYIHVLFPSPFTTPIHSLRIPFLPSPSSSPLPLTLLSRFFPSPSLSPLLLSPLSLFPPLPLPPLILFLPGLSHFLPSCGCIYIYIYVSYKVVYLR